MPVNILLSYMFKIILILSSLPDLILSSDGSVLWISALCVHCTFCLLFLLEIIFKQRIKVVHVLKFPHCALLYSLLLLLPFRSKHSPQYSVLKNLLCILTGRYGRILQISPLSPLICRFYLICTFRKFFLHRVQHTCTTTTST
jgi:hypothetical protein